MFDLKSADYWKCNQLRIETILPIVLKLQFNDACFQWAEATANVRISNNSTCTSSTKTVKT